MRSFSAWPHRRAAPPKTRDEAPGLRYERDVKQLQLERLALISLALALGSLGGWLAFLVNLPLAWMIGAMLATTGAALAGLPVRMDMRLRTVMVAVLGVLLGSGFAPEMLERLAEWSLSLGALALYVALAGAAALAFLRRFTDYSPVTSYFAAMPGGLSEMILIGGAMGGDERVISLSHALRILIVVMIIPFTFRWFYPDVASATSAAVAGSGFSGQDALILAGCGLAGFFIARALKIPAAAVVGPMVLSGFVHLMGWTAARPPFELSAAAQVVVGSAIGCRFADTKMALLWRTGKSAFFATLVLLAVAVAIAGLLHLTTGLPFAALVLAYSPGGLAEMSLIAYALDIDPAFVATHHVVRIILVVVAAPLLFRVFGGAKTGSAKTGGTTPDG